MNQNNLVDGIQTQMKIEKGLKILQFASQFYTRRAYLRNCPLNVKQDGGKYDNNGQIMAQLNQFLAQPQSQVQRRNASPFINSSPDINKTISDGKQSNNSPDSNKAKTTASKSLGSALKHKIQQSNVTPKKVVKALVDHSKPKTVKFAQKVIQKVAVKTKDKKTNNKKEIQQSTVKLQAPQSQSDDSLPADSSEDESLGKIRKIDDSVQLGGSVQMNSYHSDTKTLAVIKQFSQQQSMRIPDSKKSKLASKNEGYNLSDFTSIKNDASIVSNVSAKHFKKQPQPQSSFSCQFPSQIDKKSSKQTSVRQLEPKSQTKSFLDKSISQIKSSKERDSYITNSKINQTELHILKELSDSYIDDENMRNLMKLENMEMEEKYLLNRMERRFQKCAKQIEQIRHITWADLRMPQRNIQFRRPNYAHCFQSLK